MHDNFFVKPTPENAPEVQRELMSAMAVGDCQAFEQLYRLTSPGYSPSHYACCGDMPGQKKCCTTAISPRGTGLPRIIRRSVPR